MPKKDVDDETTLSSEEKIARLTHRKIEAITKYYPQIATTIEEALFKELKCKTKYDDLAKKMTEYADAESPGIRAAFTNTADLLRRVQEYRVTYTRTVRQRVQTKLGEYAEKCKEVAEIVKSYEDILKVKESKSAALKKARGASSSTKKSENVKKKEKAYSEANTAMVEKRRELVTHLKEFEESKLEDLKSMLRDFIQAQMWYFSRGLETLSRAYEEIDGIEKVADMKELTLLQRAVHLTDEADDTVGLSVDQQEAEELEEVNEQKKHKKKHTKKHQKKKKELAVTARSPVTSDEDDDARDTASSSDGGSSGGGDAAYTDDDDDDDEHSH